MKLLISVIIVIATIPALAQGETKAIPRPKTAVKKTAVAVALRPSTLAAPIAKVGTTVPTARTSAVAPSAVNFGAPGSSPIQYGATGMPQGGIIMPGYPMATAAAPATNSSNLQQMAPSLMSALSGMSGMKFSDDGDSRSRRRRSASSRDEENDDVATSTVRSSPRTSDDANPQPPTPTSPPATSDSTASNNPPQKSDTPSKSVPPGPQDDQVVSHNPADTQNFHPAPPTQQPAKPLQKPPQQAAQKSPPHPHFPQCGVDQKYADDPKLISAMMESVSPNMKHAETHTLGAGACRINFQKIPEPSLVLTNCKVSGSIAARVCVKDNSLVAITDSRKAVGFMLSSAPVGMAITLTPDGQGNWVMSNSVTAQKATVTEMASAESAK